MYAVTASVVPSTAEVKPMFVAYSWDLAVTAKMCEQSVALGEVAQAIAEYIFAMDMGV